MSTKIFLSFNQIYIYVCVFVCVCVCVCVYGVVVVAAVDTSFVKYHRTSYVFFFSFLVSFFV